MSACVCVCMWVTELLLADWRWSLEERPEPLQASTPQPVQNEQENVWSSELSFLSMGGVDRLTSVCAAWAAAFSAPAGGGWGTGFLQPAAGWQTEFAHASPCLARYGR